MKIRKAGYLDSPLVLAFLQANASKNALDWRVLDYPTTSVFVAESNGVVKSVLPIHTVGVLESLGHNPSATAEEKAAAVYALVHEAERLARESGIRELHFVSSDERIDESAVKHLGFERVTILRKKL